MTVSPVLWAVIVAICIAIICLLILERFSPDPLITNIGRVIIFLVVAYLVLMKLVPLIHF